MFQNRSSQFSTERLASLAELRSITPGSSAEPMVDLRKFTDALVCEYERDDMKTYTGEQMLLRKGAMERLIEAARYLESEIPGAKIRVVFAYRHPEIQDKWFQEERSRIASGDPWLSSSQLDEATHPLVAAPDVAGHPTGGAVDVTFVREGVVADMGTEIADFRDPEKIKYFSTNVTEEQRKNRRVLREVMIRAGFAPFDGEWWHFSFGDREWAFLTGKRAALYGPLDNRL